MFVCKSSLRQSWTDSGICTCHWGWQTRIHRTIALLLLIIWSLKNSRMLESILLLLLWLWDLTLIIIRLVHILNFMLLSWNRSIIELTSLMKRWVRLWSRQLWFIHYRCVISLDLMRSPINMNVVIRIMRESWKCSFVVLIALYMNGFHLWFISDCSRDASLRHSFDLLSVFSAFLHAIHHELIAFNVLSAWLVQQTSFTAKKKMRVLHSKNFTAREVELLSILRSLFHIWLESAFILPLFKFIVISCLISFFLSWFSHKIEINAFIPSYGESWLLHIPMILIYLRLKCALFQFSLF